MDSVALVPNALVLLLKLAEDNLHFLQFKVGIFALNILVLISPEKLALGILVLLVLSFKV